MGYNHFRYARRVDADTIQLVSGDNNPLTTLKTTAAGETTLYGTDTSNGDLIIKSNTVNTNPYIQLLGGNEIRFITNNQDIYLNAGGTGLVKFGTHSALAGESLSGYITIKDDGGTTRKLGVIS